MGQSHSWEADSRSADQQIPRLLRSPKFHYRVHKSPPLDPTLLASYFFNAHFIIILSSTHRSSTRYIPFRFFDWIYLCMSRPPHPSWLVHPSNVMKLFSCNFLCSRLTISPLGANIILNTLISNTLLPANQWYHGAFCVWSLEQGLVNCVQNVATVGLLWTRFCIAATASFPRIYIHYTVILSEV
jgi:hypothetical protein